MEKWRKMRKRFLSVLLSGTLLTVMLPLGLANAESGSITVDSVTVEGRENPLGVDQARFSWTLASGERNQKQSAYQIIVASTEQKATAHEGDVWDSGWVESAEQSMIPYGGEQALREKTRYYWSVQVKNQDNAVSGWSDVAWFETGIKNWDAQWLGGTDIKLLRNDFTVNPDKTIQQARAYITAQSLYELYINGEKVGDYVMTPPYTQYYARSLYDVTEMLKAGKNGIGIMLGRGEKARWYDSNMVAMLHLDVTYTDGTTDTLVTDTESGWMMSRVGPLTYDDFFYGEAVDESIQAGWTEAGYGDGEPVEDIWDRSAATAGAVSVTDVENGIRANGGNATRHLLLNGDYQDFVFDADITIHDTGNPDNNAFGLMMRGAADNFWTGYMWQINLLYNRFRPHVLGNTHVIDDPGVDLPADGNAVELEKSFHLRARANGNTFTTSINGVEFQTVDTDNTFLEAGRLGLFTVGEDVTVQNVKVTDLSGNVLLEQPADPAGGGYDSTWVPAESFSSALVVKDGKLHVNSADLLAKGTYEDFTYESEVTINRSAVESVFGFYFRKQDDNNLYMWQVNLNPGMGGMMLRPHVKDNGAWVDVRGIDLSQIDGAHVEYGVPFTFKLEAQGQVIKTYINGVLVDQWTSTHDIGGGDIGYRIAGDENIYIDDLKISNGDTVYIEDHFDSLNLDHWQSASEFNPTVTAANSFTHIAQEYDAVLVKKFDDHKAVVDFSQNMSGYAKFTATGNKGDTVTITYAELLNPEDNENIEGHTLTGKTDKLVTATYTLTGDPNGESFEPRFFYTGYRYVEIKTTGSVDIDQIIGNIKGCFVTEDMPRTGFFDSSDEVLNQVIELYHYSQIGNTIGLFLASPHREKDGWLGDAFVTCEAINYMYDSTRLYEKYFNDMIDTEYLNDSRYPDGMIRIFAPHNPKGEHDMADIPWQSGRITMPWIVYNFTGDVSILENNYFWMKLTMDFFTNLNAGKYPALGSNNAFSDWLGVDNRNGNVSATFCSDVYYYQSARLISQIAEVLGKDEDAAAYAKLAEDFKTSFNQKWLKDGRYYDRNTITSNALAITYGLVPEENFEAVGASLRQCVIDKQYKTYTGVLGTDAVYWALQLSGNSDVAEKLANEDEYPSLGYMAAMGATTLWESFEEYGNPDTTYAPELQSQNHNMYGGSVTAWAFRDLAGLQNASTGFDTIRVKPMSGAEATWAEANTMTVHGNLASSWKRTASSYELDVTIPVNASAEIYVPLNGMKNVEITESGATVYADGAGRDTTDVRFLREEDGYYVFAVGSGDYSFKLQGEAADPVVPEQPYDPLAHFTVGDNQFSGDTVLLNPENKGKVWTNADGVLTAPDKDDDYLAIFDLADLGDNYIFRGKYRVTDTAGGTWNGMRFVMGYADALNYDTIQFQKDDAYYARRWPDRWENYRVPRCKIPVGEEVAFEIVVADQRMYLSVNGEQLIDGEPIRGDFDSKVGVYSTHCSGSVYDIEVAKLLRANTVSGSINGVESDTQATVVLKKEGTEVGRANVTGNGSYTFSVDEAGAYTVAVTAKGYVSAEKAVTVEEGGNAVADFVLVKEEKPTSPTETTPSEDTEDTTTAKPDTPAPPETGYPAAGIVGSLGVLLASVTGLVVARRKHRK